MGTVLDSAATARTIEHEVEQALLRHDRVTDCAVVLRGRPMDEDPTGRCVQCGIPAVYPGIALDESGVCSLCEFYRTNRDAISMYFRELPELYDLLHRRGAGAEYDCLVLFSGGKDSTYVLHQLVEAGLRAMTFTFDNGFISRTALRNVETITEALGVEHVTMTRRDQNKVFLQSLTDHKSVCNGCFRSLLDLSNELAYQRGIPSIVTGLSRGQIIDERLSWFYQQGVFDPERIEQDLTVGRRIYHQVGGTTDERALDGVDVIDYYRYSAVTKSDIRVFLDRASVAWSQPIDTGFCSSNCMINDVGVYVHSKERGFHNYEAPTRWEVRLGHLDMAEADAELRAPVNVPRVKRMLTRIGYPDPDDQKALGGRLAAYYVTRGEVSLDELKMSVADAVPDFLVPGNWVRLDRIPRTAGAVKLAELPAPATSSRFDLGAPESAADRTFPLTPAQQAIFDRGLPRPAAQARAVLITLPEHADGGRIRRIGLDLLVRFDALRLRFERRGEQWRQRDGGVGGQVPVAGLDLSRRPGADHPRLLRAAVERLRAGLDLEKGPVVRFALVDGLAETSALLIVVHELVADFRSLRLLLSELGALWTAPEGRPATGRSFAESVTGLTGHPADTGGAKLPTTPGGPFRSHVMTVAQETADPADIQAAVSSALRRWFDGSPVSVDLVNESTDSTVPFGQFHGGIPSGGAWVVVRYFGALPGLVHGTPFEISTVDIVDPVVLPEIAPYRLEIDASRRAGGLCLDWRCAEPLYEMLSAAGVPDDVAGQLA